MNRLHHPRRRAMASVLAMLYLVLFSTMAIGVYAAATTGSQLAVNDQRISHALLAAESGLDFMRYQLARVHIPPSTPPTQVIDSLFQNLQSQLNSTTNLHGQPVARSGNTITIPGNGNYISLDSAGLTAFRATITDWAGEIVVKIDGRYGNNAPARAISMDFTRQPHSTTVFDYAVASKGQIVGSKGAVGSTDPAHPEIATMMSAFSSSDAIFNSGTAIGGDLYYVDGSGVRITGGSVAGYSPGSSNLYSHIHSLDTPPEFPIIDTSIFAQYATNTYSSHSNTQQNIRIPPNTNPKFNGNSTVQGIMYVQSPNSITFNGNFKLQGFIVFENAGSDAVNSLNFSGNFTQSPLPAGSQFDALRATSGISILAPAANVSMTGSSGGTLVGNVIASTFSTGGASAIIVSNGTLMTLNPNVNSCVFGSSKQVLFSNNGSQNQPTQGLSYSFYYSPKPVTYQELLP